MISAYLLAGVLMLCFWSLPGILSKRWFLFGGKVSGIPALCLVSALFVLLWPLYLSSSFGRFLSIEDPSLGKKADKNQENSLDR
jgi:hypothetical protein